MCHYSFDKWDLETTMNNIVNEEGYRQEVVRKQKAIPAR